MVFLGVQAPPRFYKKSSGVNKSSCHLLNTHEASGGVLSALCRVSQETLLIALGGSCKGVPASGN